MARYHFIGRSRDSYGNNLSGIPVSIYLAGTTTSVKIHLVKEVGDTGIIVEPQIISDDEGLVSFYVDDTEYDRSGVFDIKIGVELYKDVDIFRNALAGSSGTSGTSGSSGSSGISGSSGTSGTSGFGTSGSSGSSGTSGTSGSSGFSGTSGSSGFSGTSGSSGSSGSSGTSGSSGSSGTSGSSGSSGTSAIGMAFSQTFTNDDLVDGILLVNHHLGNKYVVVSIYNNESKLIVSGDITLIDTHSLEIDLSGYGAIDGSWLTIITYGVGYNTGEYALRYNEDSDPILYVGEAEAGTSDDVPLWRIKRIDVSDDNAVVTWADGNILFDNVWTDFTNLNYL